MIERNEAVTVSLVRLALDAASLRHQAIATNIANAGNAEHRPLRVSFEEQLDAARRELNSRGRVGTGSLSGVTPRLIGDAAPGERPLDLETANMAQNTMQYQALLKGLSKYMSIVSAAINEGKR
ncbi:hypothetical protein [Chitinimonas lacunae]|uniref:Flagellar basal body rod protein FlgB n=1 Tax=Chitinimonas lacunae TaxID=1963018 RepID=A0ABV8MU72_9NEIS